MTDQRSIAELPLQSLNAEQWEALCDGCGRCCQLRFQDEDSHDIIQTCIACDLYDCSSGRCRDYANRQRWVPECWVITAENLPQIAHWMPRSCAYRLRYEGKNLPPWHPLLSDNPDAKFLSGKMMREQCVSEIQAKIDGWEQYMVDIEAAER